MIAFDLWTCVPVLCGARRGRFGKVRCENSALRAAGCKMAPYFGMHVGRGKDGRWFFWPVD